MIIGKYSGGWTHERLTAEEDGKSVLDPLQSIATQARYNPSDLRFPQNEIFNNSGFNQIFFITPLQKEIEMEFILNEVGENFYEYNPTLSSFQDMNSCIEMTLDIQILSLYLSITKCRSSC